MTPVPHALASLHRPSPSLDPGAGLTPTAATGLGFADLLGRASRGGMDSGRPVTLGRGVEAGLSSEQWARVGSAVDRAEAAGASLAMVLVDGTALTVDVLRREVTAAAPAEPGRVHHGIDALVVAESTGPQPAEAAPGPSPLPRNTSLTSLLASRAGAA